MFTLHVYALKGKSYVIDSLEYRILKLLLFITTIINNANRHKYRSILLDI